MKMHAEAWRLKNLWCSSEFRAAETRGGNFEDLLAMPEIQGWYQRMLYPRCKIFRNSVLPFQSLNRPWRTTCFTNLIPDVYIPLCTVLFSCRLVRALLAHGIKCVYACHLPSFFDLLPQITYSQLRGLILLSIQGLFRLTSMAVRSYILFPRLCFDAYMFPVVGGSNFGTNISTAILRGSECTSIPIPQDKSNYWYPVCLSFASRYKGLVQNNWSIF